MTKKKVRKKKPRSAPDILRLIAMIAGGILMVLAIAAIVIRYYRFVSKH